MATVSELDRREQAIELIAKILTFTCITESITLIEQALLAERRLARIDAFEEAGLAIADSKKLSERDQIIACVAIRAAAEKEVGTK